MACTPVTGLDHPPFREPAARVWESLELSDGELLRPLGLVTSPAGNDVWVWRGARLIVSAGPEDLPGVFCLVVAHVTRKPTSAERRLVLEAFGLERAQVNVKLPPIEDRHAVYVLGRRPTVRGLNG